MTDFHITLLHVVMTGIISHRVGEAGSVVLFAKSAALWVLQEPSIALSDLLFSFSSFPLLILHPNIYELATSMSDC